MGNSFVIKLLVLARILGLSPPPKKKNDSQAYNVTVLETALLAVADPFDVQRQTVRLWVGSEGREFGRSGLNLSSGLSVVVVRRCFFSRPCWNVTVGHWASDDRLYIGGGQSPRFVYEIWILAAKVHWIQTSDELSTLLVDRIVGVRWFLSRVILSVCPSRSIV